MTCSVKISAVVLASLFFPLSVLAGEPEKNQGGVKHAEHVEPDSPEEVATHDEFVDQADVARSETTEDRLERLLKQAADSGYVSLRTPNSETETYNSDKSHKHDVTETPKEILPKQADTGIEKPPKRTTLRASAIGTDKPRPVPRKCESKDSFYFDDQAKKLTYNDIFQLRQDLLNDRQEYSIQSTKELAKAYISLGLGEEAVAVAKVLSSEEGRLLTAMGHIIALDDLEDRKLLKQYVTCTDLVLPWHAISLTTDSPIEALSLASRSVDIIFDFPVPIRNLFATHLGILAAEEEQWKLAEKLSNLTESTAKNPDASVHYLRSLLDSHFGNKEAIEVMKSVAMQSSSVQAKALLSVGRMAIENDTRPYKSYLTDLDLVKTQYKGHREGTTAEIMEIRLLADRIDYTELVEKVLTTFESSIEDRKIARDIVAASMQRSFADKNTDRKFSALTGYVDHKSFFDGYQQIAQLKQLAAETALFFELPVLVFSILENSEKKDQMQETDRILAEAALLDDKPVQALKLASRYDNDIFRNISVAAAQNMEIPDQAIQLLEKMPETKENLTKRAVLAWNTGRWQAAKEAYADLLLADGEDEVRDRHALAAYMSGEGGGFYSLDTDKNIPGIKILLDTYVEEKEILERYLSNG